MDEHTLTEKRDVVYKQVLAGHVNEIADDKLPIYDAVIHSDFELFELCLKNGANPHLCSNGLMPEESLRLNSLYYFIVCNLISIFDLSKSSVINREITKSLLSINLMMIEILAQIDVDVNTIIMAGDEDGVIYTTNVLFWLVKFDCHPFVNKFLNIGADPHLKTVCKIQTDENAHYIYSSSPLIEAIRCQNMEVIKILVEEYMVDIDNKFINNGNALCHSMLCDNLDIFEYLIDRNAEINEIFLYHIMEYSLEEKSHFRREEIIYILYLKNILSQEDLQLWCSKSDNNFDFKQYLIEKDLTHILYRNVTNIFTL